MVSNVKNSVINGHNLIITTSLVVSIIVSPSIVSDVHSHLVIRTAVDHNAPVKSLDTTREWNAINWRGVESQAESIVDHEGDAAAATAAASTSADKRLRRQALPADWHIDVIITTRHDTTASERANARALTSSRTRQAGRSQAVSPLPWQRAGRGQQRRPPARLLLHLQSGRSRGTNPAMTSSNRRARCTRFYHGYRDANQLTSPATKQRKKTSRLNEHKNEYRCCATTPAPRAIIWQISSANTLRWSNGINRL